MSFGACVNGKIKQLDQFLANKAITVDEEWLARILRDGRDLSAGFGQQQPTRLNVPRIRCTTHESISSATGKIGKLGHCCTNHADSMGMRKQFCDYVQSFFDDLRVAF